MDPYLKAGVSVSKREYKSEMPKTRSKKMLYSSVPEEERRRKQQIEEDRNDADFERLPDATQDNLEATLGQTQTLNELGNLDSSPRDLGARRSIGNKKYAALVQDTTQQDVTAVDEIQVENDNIGKLIDSSR